MFHVKPCLQVPLSRAPNVSRETMSSSSASADWVSLGSTYGIAVTPDQAARLEALAWWLAERAYPLGLTNYRTAAEVTQHALLPTLALFSLAASPLSGPLLDLGAGSGALGLTVALLCPDLPVVLADRRKRSAAFLSLTKARLQLHDVEVQQVSVEAWAKDQSRRFEVVCCRALAPAQTALRLAEPLLAPGGWVAVWHRGEDPVYHNPPACWLRRATVSTALPGLCASRLEIVSRETIDG